ncbi:hypothetical protein BDQ17DRAFT_1441671 [Cyathus striatus]|nr:hypothetical protein BDQ17DRAFT_1441671 [Cyathus striatus]
MASDKSVWVAVSLKTISTKPLSLSFVIIVQSLTTSSLVIYLQPSLNLNFVLQFLSAYFKKSVARIHYFLPTTATTNIKQSASTLCLSNKSLALLTTPPTLSLQAMKLWRHTKIIDITQEMSHWLSCAAMSGSMFKRLGDKTHYR